MREFLTLTKAMSDETRLRTLMLLQERELCVCQIIEMLGLAPSTVSKHMSILKQAGLVETHKEGRWIYYRLVDRKALKECEILDWLERHLKNDKRILEDVKQLRRMQKMSKDELCECYKRAKI